MNRTMVILWAILGLGMMFILFFLGIVGISPKPQEVRQPLQLQLK